jgi:hypothetical protein
LLNANDRPRRPSLPHSGLVQSFVRDPLSA